MRVIKIGGERRGMKGTVRAINFEENRFAVLFDGDKIITHECDPKEFKIHVSRNIHLTGQPPPNTVARGSH